MKTRIKNLSKMMKPHQLILLFALAQLLVGCVDEKPNMEAMLTMDISASYERKDLQSTDEIYSHLLKLLEIEEADAFVRNGIIVYSSNLGHSSRPKISKLVLKPAGHWIATHSKKREEEIQAYKSELYKMIEDWLESASDQGASHLHCGLAHQLRMLKKSDFGREKYLLAFTDGIQSSPEVDFSDYKDQKEQFKRDFDRISKKLNQVCPLPDDLSGIELVFVNSPQASNDVFLRVSDAFWYQHFGRTGVGMDILSNL